MTHHEVPFVTVVERIFVTSAGSVCKPVYYIFICIEILTPKYIYLFMIVSVIYDYLTKAHAGLL